MINFTDGNELNQFIKDQKAKGKSIGFVPTMGALHPGHLSLIKASKEECDITVCSIFVNPTQFNNADDLVKYPRTLESDSAMLESVNCDVLFAPNVETMYPDGTDKFEAPDLGELLQVLEGEHRPGHFAGVMQVVSLLLDFVNPDKLYMGLKDFQQFAICSAMVEVQGRNIEMRGMPIFRERNGLAMSSRNKRLSEEAKQNASVIFESLTFAKVAINYHSTEDVKKIAMDHIHSVKGTEIEYFEIVNQKSLKSTESKQNLIALCAVWLEDVRLIDNMILN